MINCRIGLKGDALILGYLVKVHFKCTKFIQIYTNKVEGAKRYYPCVSQDYVPASTFLF